MAGATTSQTSPTPDKPDRQDDDCGVFSKPSSTESCDNIVELSAHSAHEKPSNKIPRLDNDANAPTLRQFECDDPDHLDIVINSAIQQEKFSDSSEELLQSVISLRKQVWSQKKCFGPFILINQPIMFHSTQKQLTIVKTHKERKFVEYGSHITKRIWQFIAHFV